MSAPILAAGTARITGTLSATVVWREGRFDVYWSPRMPKSLTDAGWERYIELRNSVAQRAATVMNGEVLTLTEMPDGSLVHESFYPGGLQ
jgi:hypothetical protein